jgi:hypothetical protein
LNLTTATLHKWAYLKSHNRAYVTDNNQNIKSVNTSWTVAAPGSDYAIDIGGFSDVGYISTIEASSDTIWIGTVRPYINGSSSMTKASIYEWDGISSQVTREYKINALGVYAIEIIDNIPYVIDSNGVWSVFNSNGFKEIGRFPFKTNQFLSIPSSTTPTERFVHPNGTAATPDGTLLAFVGNVDRYLQTTNGGLINENFPSGIWEWSDGTGVIHRHSISLDRLTSSTNTDYGQNRTSVIGAMGDAKLGSDEALPIASWICGATYYTNASSTTTGIFVQSPAPTDNGTYPEGQKHGYLVTTWLDASGIQDEWAHTFAKYKKFLRASDSTTLKYRSTEVDATTIDMTWVDATSFTTTTDLTGKEGYEVEITSGIGGGITPHIVSVTNNAGTYTVVIDESFTAFSGTARARVQDWKKVGTFDYTEDWGLASIGVVASRIQVKCCMKFTGDEELHSLYVINKPYKRAE